MPDLLLPPYLKTARIAFQYLDTSGVSRGVFGGPPRIATLGGDRLHASLDFSPTATSAPETAQERRTLIALLARLQGKQNRIYLTNPARKLAGSFPAAELLTNNTFANGMTGWTFALSVGSVHDRVLRITASQTGGNVQFYQSVVLTQYAPHVLRSMILDGRGTAGLILGPVIGSATFQVDAYSAARGLKTVALVPETAGALNQFPMGFASSSGFVAGDFVEVPWCSLSRCALVDNSPNAMTRPDELDHADWTKVRATASANTSVAPDGTTTADSLIEDGTVSNSHFTTPTTVPTRTSVAEDLLVYGDFKRGVGTRDILLQVGSDGANLSQCNFDLGAGTAGSVSNVGTATNGRAFIRNLGNGWYRCYLVMRAAASTMIYSAYTMLNAGTSIYTGDSTSSVLTWRRGSCRSSLPVNPPQTVGTAVPSGTAQTGNGINVKGLPVSTNGLLLPLDEVEIITSFGSELKIVTAALNSDAAGLGHLQFSPPIRGVLADNAAVVIHEPMGFFFFAGNAVGWEHTAGIETNASAEFEEAS